MAAIIVPDLPHSGRIHNPRHLSLSLGGIMDPNESFAQPDVSITVEGPPPNPPFSFPSKPMAASTPRAAGRRPKSVADFGGMMNTRPLGSPELPAFSFNPGANLSPSPTPTTTTADDFMTPSRLSPAKSGHGHRRGGSEFVGGQYRSGNARMEMLSMDTPETDSGKLLLPLLPATDPPRPRGPAHRHAHRRSAAISSHDLNAVLGLNLPKVTSTEPRGNSAPSSPSLQELNTHFSFPLLRPNEIKPQMDMSTFSPPEEKVPDEVPELPTASPELAPTPRKSFSKARVGFSDTLEFIPRPLSLISSDASSTATVRPGHSVSGSYSSIISISNSVIMEEYTVPLESTLSQNGFRPSTAGEVLDRTPSQSGPGTGSIAKRRGSMPLLTEISLPLPEPTSSANPSPAKSTSSSKKWSFFGLDHFPGSGSPLKSRPASLESRDATKDSASPSVSKHDLKPSTFACPAEKTIKKHSKKQRKVKTWAGSILTKRSKGRYGKGKKASRRGPTPPPLCVDDEDEEDNVSDSAETKSEPGMPTVMIEELDDQDQGGMEAWKPPRLVTEADTAYPVIDLDAALGPFNTPLPRNAEWEEAQKAGGSLKRRLHSAAGMSRFTGPGMHYTHHQRAQSSPEMPPFEFSRGISRFGSSSTMADVFEEEEEDDNDSDIAMSSSSTGSSTPQAGPAAVKGHNADSLDDFFSARTLENMADKDAIPVVKRHGSDPEETRLHRSSSMRSRNSLSSLQELVIEEEPEVSSPFRTVEFGRPAAYKRLSAIPDSPLSSPVSSRAPESSSSQTTATSSLAPISPYSTTASSSFPSPRSLIYDGTILSSAPSSVTDDSYRSLLMGEPGPEVRRSFDVPSLASSHSTQPRENSFASQSSQLNRAPAPGERPASFALAFGGRRGSLASLSRLISSSHGERSKLSLEAYNSDLDKKSKTNKAKSRISRMVQFWKSKEQT